MNLKKYVILYIFILSLILSACSPAENRATNEMEGIELKLIINKQDISPDDEVVAKVILTNHNNAQKEIFVPIPKDTEEGITAVMVERKNQTLWQLLNPQNTQDIPNIKERSFYDYVLVQLGANETIEQEFRWNKELLNQESREIVAANSGEYILSAFILLDELNNQKDYYEPEKQLISILGFTVK
ncbi:hypothetical protein [Solibacillus sp. CAU 1738]|uniref:hypothetical protein n=1 Tax=Solibacillus sp. CAU 1738 TaxID=3140363 RepID=UPI00326055B9